MADTLTNKPSLRSIRKVPLRYRLSVAFLFLAFFGTFLLVGLAIRSQNEIIRHQEQERLLGYYRSFQHHMLLEGRWAVSLASNFARNPEVARALADRDRLRLIRLCYPAYLFMKKHYGVSQFNFHTLPPRMFVRLHRLYEFGDNLSYRETIEDAINTSEETFGLEKGLTGYGIRGVAPVFYKGELVGTSEIGFGFGSIFLQQLRGQFGIQASFLIPDEQGGGFHSFATTFDAPFRRNDPVYQEVFQTRQPQLLIEQISGQPYAILVGPVQDYNDRTVAVVELCVNRADTLALIDDYRQLMLGIGIIGMLLSVGGIYIISSYFTRPIGKMVAFARQIALNRQVKPLDISPSGELADLAVALDDMLIALNESRKKIENYTDNLEHMVHLRTRALRESEEKYRTLVENVPLVVYRLLGNGKIIFINHFVEDLIGLTVRQVLEMEDFWKEKVWEEDRDRIWPVMDRCLEEGMEFKAEYRVRHANGKLIFVQGHALPILDEQGKVETVDGFLVNITDRHRLQQQIIQTEELRTLSEVSARLAHEIRNPLVAAGGFARRLLQSLPEDDPNRERVQIIVQEVARLEKILEKTLAYLKPFEVVLERTSLNDLCNRVIDQQESICNEFSVKLELNLSPNLPPVALDQVLFKTVLDSLTRALLDYCRPGGTLEIRTYPGEHVVNLEMNIKDAQVSEDEIEHFFYPFTSRLDPFKTLDLPLAKMIIHKHKGLISLRKRSQDQLSLNISLPQ
jgi:PAS domain S-box-containing protein